MDPTTQRVTDMSMQVESQFQAVDSPRPISIDFEVDSPPSESMEVNSFISQDDLQDINIAMELSSSSNAQLRVTVKRYPTDLELGLSSIAHHAVYKNISLDPSAPCDIELTFEYNLSMPPGHLQVSSIEYDGMICAVVSYHRKIEAFRGLGRILAVSFDSQMKLNFKEEAQFETLG